MAEASDYLRRWDFTENAGISVASQTADADNLTIVGSGGSWVTSAGSQLDAVGYQFTRAGDDRAETLVTGGDLFSGVEYTIAVRASLPAALPDAALAQAAEVVTLRVAQVYLQTTAP